MRSAANNAKRVHTSFWRRWRRDFCGEMPARVPPPGARLVWNRSGEGQWVAKYAQGDRVQYVHPRSVLEANRDTNFEANRRFGRRWEAICDKYTRDLQRDGAREQILALMIALIDQKCFRPGNEMSAQRRAHFGLTTLESRHVRIGKDRTVTFSYVGKQGEEQRKIVFDAALFPLLERLKRACGSRRHVRFFRFEGRPLTAADLNTYLAELGVTVKQFRQFHATRIATTMMLDAQEARGGALSTEERADVLKRVREAVAAHLGNRPKTAEESYIDPALVRAFLEGRLTRFLRGRSDRAAKEVS